MKFCSNKTCKQNNPQSLGNFRKCKSSSDGLFSWCKNCKNEADKEYRLAHPNECRRAIAEWQKQNSDKVNANSAKYRKDNPKTARTAVANWAKNNRHKRNATQAKRRAAKLQRTPKWLTDTHFKEINEFYKTASNRTMELGEPYHVDHIVPLQGENVSGLHVPWNLQIISGSENSRKFNRYES